MKRAMASSTGSGSHGPYSLVPTVPIVALAYVGLMTSTAKPWVDDRWLVSVKGVLGWGDRFVVLRNRRGEWELPGGRMDATDDSPMATLRREMSEELDLEVEVGKLIDSWIYEVEGKRILILTYQCRAEQPPVMVHSDEHTEVDQFSIKELGGEAIPGGYLRSIRATMSASDTAAFGTG